MLTVKQVSDALCMYKQIVARRALLSEDIEACERGIRFLDHDELIDEAAVRGQSYDNADMPRGTLTSDPTASLAIRMIEGSEPRQKQEMENELRKLRRERSMIDRNIAMMDGWLSCLKEKERMVILWRVVDGSTWPETIDKFEAEFGLTYSLNGVKKVSKRALERIARNYGE